MDGHVITVTKLKMDLFYIHFLWKTSPFLISRLLLSASSSALPPSSWAPAHLYISPTSHVHFVFDREPKLLDVLIKFPFLTNILLPLILVLSFHRAYVVDVSARGPSPARHYFPRSSVGRYGRPLLLQGPR